MKRVAACLFAIAFAFSACTSTSTSTNGDGGSGGDGGNGDSGSDWCEIARQVDDESESIAQAFVQSGAADALEKLYAEFESTVGQALAVAPAEIKADVETVAAVFKEVAAELAKVDYNIETLLATDPGALERFNTAELEAATQRIADYNERVCGISQEEETIAPSPGTDIGAVPPEILEQQLAPFGITSEQAECLAPKFTDPNFMDQPDSFNNALRECGVDPSVFTEPVVPSN